MGILSRESDAQGKVLLADSQRRNLHQSAAFGIEKWGKVVIRMKNALLSIVLVFVCGLSTAAQMEIIEIDKPQLANVVAGVVVDPSGGTLPRVTVEEHSADWKSVLRSTETDEKGRFQFSPTTGKSTYYLQFARSGFNWLRLKLQLDKRSKRTVIVRMELGT